MTRTTTRVLIALTALLLTATIVVAQHDHAATTNQSGSQAADNDMMKSCQKHGTETMAAFDKLDKTIAAGRESNDPAKMKAALDQAQTQLAEAKHHMSMCPMTSGGKMQHHGGMGHMQHMHGESGQQQTAPTDKTPH
jgi:GTP-binding protein EngB required for normal cell division